MNLLSSGILFMLKGRREGERRDGGSFWAAPAPSGHRAKGSTHYLTILQITEHASQRASFCKYAVSRVSLLAPGCKAKEWERGHTERISIHYQLPAGRPSTLAALPTGDVGTRALVTLRGAPAVSSH